MYSKRNGAYIKKLIVIFNHGKLTEDQAYYAYDVLKIGEIIYMNEELKSIWSEIDPFEDVVNVEKIEEFLLKSSKPYDYVLVQGEFGATFKTVNFCLENERIAIYATTERVSREMRNDDGSVSKTSEFKFVRFREYG
ncbi:MAG: hypothetical protein JXR48_13560 [Candidatus Delongbacteria bacterium]|nr:hypothetical protein [Candidatus Delongbacteria bacterium]MBN2835983.1 hypothetical protein [Candidatus Delongbacteria bacterium]